MHLALSDPPSRCVFGRHVGSSTPLLALCHSLIDCLALSAPLSHCVVHGPMDVWIALHHLPPDCPALSDTCSSRVIHHPLLLCYPTPAHPPHNLPQFDCCIHPFFAPAALPPPHCCPTQRPLSVPVTIKLSHPPPPSNTKFWCMRREGKQRAAVAATAIGIGFGVRRQCAAQSGTATAMCGSSPLVILLLPSTNFPPLPLPSSRFLHSHGRCSCLSRCHPCRWSTSRHRHNQPHQLRAFG